MIKKTAIVFIFLLVVGCSKEEDTRLICEHIETKRCEDGSTQWCSIDQYPSRTEKIYTFNEGKKEFLDTSYKSIFDQVDFNKNEIFVRGVNTSYNPDSKTYMFLDRITLQLREHVDHKGSYIDNEGEKEFFHTLVIKHYQCRVVDGI